MDVLKYFYEEPALLEALAPAQSPDARTTALPLQPLGSWLDLRVCYRGYLAGTRLDTFQVGLTALSYPEAFVDPLLDCFSGLSWWVGWQDGRVEPVEEKGVGVIWKTPETVAVVVGSEKPVAAEIIRVVAEQERRQGMADLLKLLETATVVFFPEPAHHGFDWSFFAASPQRENLTDVLRRHPHPEVRRFVLPYQKARSEHMFYFEQWHLDHPLPSFIEAL